MLYHIILHHVISYRPVEDHPVVVRAAALAAGDRGADALARHAVGPLARDLMYIYIYI